MKQGNQFYLEVQLFDNSDTKLDVSSVKKVQFNIGELTKTYPKDVAYENDTFKIWLTENETFRFDNNTSIDVRVLFKNDTIMGTEIETIDVSESLKEVNLDA